MRQTTALLPLARLHSTLWSIPCPPPYTAHVFLPSLPQAVHRNDDVSVDGDRDLCTEPIHTLDMHHVRFSPRPAFSIFSLQATA